MTSCIPVPILPQIPPGAHKRLDLLQDMIELLCIDDPFGFSSYSSAVTQLSEDSLSVQRLLNRLGCIEYELQSHLSSIKYEQRLVERWNTLLEARESEEDSSVTLERRKEDLVRKAKEYHGELQTVLKTMPEAPRITVTRLKEQEKKNKEKEQQLRAKRAKIKAFKGLPPNLQLARHGLRQVRHELEKLTQLRERLLARMAEGVS